MEEERQKDFGREERMIDRVIVIEVLMDGKEEKPDISQNHSELCKEINLPGKFSQITNRDLAGHGSIRCNPYQRNNRQREEPWEKTEDPGLHPPNKEETLNNEEDKGKGEGVLFRVHCKDSGKKRGDEIER